MTDEGGPDPRRRSGLAPRLFAGILLVLVAGAATAWLVASSVGPALFHDHMARAGLGDNDAAVVHADRAFQSASGLSLGLALAAAAAASIAVSLVLTRRIGRSLSAASAAAVRLGAGEPDVRLAPPGLGAEFEDLAHAFNTTAERLDEAERLRHRLLADVAHEVRTPVATLTAYLEALEDDVEQLTPEVLAVLRAQATRLTRLTADLAAVTTAESGALGLEQRLTPPGDLVTAAVDAARERAVAAGVRLSATVEPNLPAVGVDKHRLAQVLDNLVANALRHTPTDGDVVVAARRGRAGGVELVVTDTGEGIAPEHLSRVFDRFYRVDTARDRGHGGSGVGLAIVRALVEAHGGTVTAASEGSGRGSVFVVSLP